MTSAPLFDNVNRPDLGPRLYAEDTYSFLNRATGPFWERIRGKLDRWSTAYPDETGDLRRRFRSRDHRQHYGAWWELYIHQLLTSLGFEVTPHPEVHGSSGRPDFLARRRRDAFYVEAVTEFSGIAANPPRSALEPAILDVINEVDASDFFVSVRLSQIGTSMPRRRQITGPIAAWLATSTGCPDVLTGQPTREDASGRRLGNRASRNAARAVVPWARQQSAGRHPRRLRGL